ncbi:MAG: hypothetical protein LUD81_05685 [Clostridiales bacterium]|nr:hypothetical protein [Clostridiales bacterium]
MGEDKKFGDDIKIWHIVCAVVCVLLAGILVFMIYKDNREQSEKTEAMEELQAEAKSYEEKCRELKDEISFLENNVYYSSEYAEIIVGFIVSDVSDTDYIEKKAAAYNFKPVFIIDCTKDISDIKKIIDKIGDKGEIMLYASYFSESVKNTIISVNSYLKSAGQEHTGVFFLRNSDLNDSNVEFLLSEGFVGFTIYNDSPKAGQLENDAVYFDYSYLSSSGTAVLSRIGNLYQNKASMILGFDMESINSGMITEIYMEDLFDGILTYTDYYDCYFSTTANVVAELSQINKTEAERRIEYEKQAAEIQKEIDGLEKTIHDIYKKIEQ